VACLSVALADELLNLAASSAPRATMYPRIVTGVAAEA